MVSACIVNRLRATRVKISGGGKTGRIRTERRTPIPAKIAFDGGNA